MPRRVALLWALFLIRGAFYCTMLPLWEGWDEYAHFGWLLHWNSAQSLPRYDTPMPREVEESLRLTPLTQELAWLGPGHFTYEQWWALPEAERAERARQLEGLRGQWAGQVATTPLVFYEAQQPPLYYWVIAQPLKLIDSAPLEARVRVLRLVSLLLASSVIPLFFWAASAVVSAPVATFGAALLAIAPGLMIDVSRIANDGLAIALTALVLAILVREKPGWMLGLALGAALLTKAYLLSLLPAVLLLRRRRALLPLGFALGIAAWWYIRNLTLGYALSGWLDKADSPALLSAVSQINWPAAANVVSKSFLWFGAWSFLTLKSWAYLLLDAVAAIGAFRAARTPRLAAAWTMVLSHLAAMTYGVVVYYAVHHMGNLPGWYLWPMAAPLALLLAAGLGRWTTGLVGLLALADIYGATALMAPYYAGFVARNRANAGPIVEALTRLHTPLWLAALYLGATLAVVAVSAYISVRNPLQTPRETA
jgi:hypothetical protein